MLSLCPKRKIVGWHNLNSFEYLRKGIILSVKNTDIFHMTKKTEQLWSLGTKYSPGDGQENM